MSVVSLVCVFVICWKVVLIVVIFIGMMLKWLLLLRLWLIMCGIVCS